jgi:hypothetical protein
VSDNRLHSERYSREVRHSILLKEIAALALRCGSGPLRYIGPGANEFCSRQEKSRESREASRKLRQAQKRSAVVELFLGDMGSMQRELRPSNQREDQLTMETKLEQIAVKAVNQLPKSVVREIRTPRSVGTRGRATASGDPMGWETGRWPKAPSYRAPSSTLP